MNRREFLIVAGSAAAGITLGHYGLGRLLPGEKDPSVPGSRGLGLSEDREAISTCGGCPAGCSLLVRVVYGRLVGVRGNPNCPLGAGGPCPRGLSEIEAFYDPDRLVGPIRRLAERGQGRWKRLSWKNALSEVTRRLSALAQAGRGDRIAVVLSSGDGSTSAVVRRVLAGFGSPHVYHTDCLRDEAALSCSAVAFGRPRPHGFDLAGSDLLFSFGTPVLEGWLSPAWVARCFGEGRKRKRNRLRLIQVDSRLSPTAIHADEWVRCLPGKQPVLALAMARVMLSEGLVDRRAQKGITGIEPWTDASGKTHPGFRRVLDYAYTPHAASIECGVPVVDILRLARMFARARSPLALGEQTAGSAGVFGLAAVNLLNALSGRIGKRGGVIFPKPVPVAPLGGPEVPERGRIDCPPVTSLSGTSVFRALGALQMEGHKPPFDVLFIEDGSALGDVVSGDPALEMLRRVPLVVSLASGLDKSVAMADLVLPATTNFEQAVDVEISPAGGFAALAVSRPVVSTLVDGRPIADVFLELNRRVGSGGDVGFSTADEVVKHRLRGLHRSRRGLPYSSKFRRDWLAQMERAGWWSPEQRDEVAFLNAVFSRGGWVDPLVPEEEPSADHPYAVDGRVHRACTRSGALFDASCVDDTWVPRAEEPETTVKPANALLLVPIAVGAFSGGGTPNRPSLLQIAMPSVYGAFAPWVELHPRDAARLGIEAGDQVGIASEYGEVVVAARVTPGVRAGTVALPWAPAAGGQGRYARSWKPSAELLAAGTYGALTGARIVKGLPVQVYPAERGEPG